LLRSSVFLGEMRNSQFPCRPALLKKMETSRCFDPIRLLTNSPPSPR
jgi:hypothetical protein